MKKLVVLTAALLLSVSAFCQELDNKVYFRFGYSIPSWNYFELGKDGWDSDVTKLGANFDLGTIIQVMPIGAGDQMSIGLNFDIAYLSFSRFQTINDEEGTLQDGTGEDLVDDSGEDLIGYGSTANLGIFRAGSKIGPCLTYCPGRRTAIDLFAKADIAWATLMMPYGKDLGDLDDKYSASVTLGYAAGLNFRYGKLMIGVEYNAINPKLEYRKERGTYFQQQLVFMVDTGDDYTFEFPESDLGKKESKMRNLNLTVGMCF
ncbi:hypothetical protein [Mangrovibacterium diazotrophicum]|uniref:Outer membrane protein with beta-barrel domain n=1 Tax=Mangrovibacterium diazotrophicum TaxID=1261403 RepID=A0A419WBL1_9BACT|nr:hypothetical protein [Mangrovibacterium diazotrophicum]RKD92802.1 hypothetical protein BC643_3179 [Mangrovibacterium diazotrophicum]